MTAQAVASVVALSLLGACVTVNVNFPESAVQKATDDYVRDLYRAKSKGTKTDDPATGPSSTAPAPQPTALLDLLLASAHADDGAFKVSTPKALSIKDRLAGRLDEVLQWKRQGILGESRDGQLVVRGGDKLKPIQKKKIDALVDAENADRAALYTDVAETNGLSSERATTVKSSFARSFQAESPSGTWLQSSDGSWSQKP